MAAASGLFAEINGARLFHRVEGAGPALVLIHAGIADLRMWDEHVAHLAASHRVVLYDLRGFGRSSMPEGFYSHIEDLKGLLDALGLERAALLGASYGGRVAIEFAIRYPLRVSALVLVAPGLGGFAWSKEMQDYGERSDALAAKGDLEGLVDLDLRMWVAGPRRRLEEVDPLLVERAAVWVRGANARWNEQAKGTAQWLDPPAVSRLRSVRAPTIVLVGDLDTQDMAAVAEQIERDLPQAKRVVLPGAAHLLPTERPEEFRRTVLEFLSKQGGLPTVGARR